MLSISGCSAFSSSMPLIRGITRSVTTIEGRKAVTFSSASAPSAASSAVNPQARTSSVRPLRVAGSSSTIRTRSAVCEVSATVFNLSFNIDQPTRTIPDASEAAAPPPHAAALADLVGNPALLRLSDADRAGAAAGPRRHGAGAPERLYLLVWLGLLRVIHARVFPVVDIRVRGVGRRYGGSALADRVSAAAAWRAAARCVLRRPPGPARSLRPACSRSRS